MRRDAPSARPAVARVTGGGLSAAAASVLLLVAAVAAAGVAVVYLRVIPPSVLSPWALNFSEGGQLAAVMRVRDGAALYPDYRVYPYQFVPYGPIQYVFCGLMSRLLALSPYGTLEASRLVTVASAAAAAWLVYLLARAEGATRVSAGVGAALLLPQPLVGPWTMALRPDLPALALSLAALVLVTRRPARVGPAAAVATLALFTKQNEVAAGGAIALWLVWEGRARLAARFVALSVALAAAGLVALHLATGGNFEQSVLVGQLAQARDGLADSLGYLLALPLLAPWLVGLAVLGLLGRWRERRQPGLSGCYLFVALATAAYVLQGRGANVNHLVEPTAACCVLAAHGLDVARVLVSRSAGIGSLLAALGVVICVVSSARGGAFWLQARQMLGQPDDLAIAVDLFRERDVLAVDVMPIVLTGRQPVTCDLFILTMLSQAGSFDPSDLAARVARQEFDAVVLLDDVAIPTVYRGQPFLPESVRQAIAQRYVFERRVEVHGSFVPAYWFYVPRRHAARAGRAAPL